jgi:hypothetical protein
MAQEAQDGLVVGRSDDGGTCGAARVARPSMRRSTRERLADPVHSPRARWQTPYGDNLVSDEPGRLIWKATMH